MSHAHDFFAHKSKSWDMSSRRVQNAKAIASEILKNINIPSSAIIADIGVGTGLLSYFLSPYVARIDGIDNSPSMLEVLRQKRETFAAPIRIEYQDVEHTPLLGPYDGIVSSMTLHHIGDIDRFFKQAAAALKPGGFIAIADLDSEDGTFHSDDTGVKHFGFDRDILRHKVQNAGFSRVRFETVHTIAKPHRNFPIFLMTAVLGIS